MIIGGITLPNPEWSDSVALKTKLHVHRMMDGDVESYIQDSLTANWRKVSLHFSNVDHDTVQLLLTYLKSKADTFITLTDHNSIFWNCLLTSTPLSVVWDNRGVDCDGFSTSNHNERGSFTFEFEGSHA